MSNIQQYNVIKSTFLSFLFISFVFLSLFSFVFPLFLLCHQAIFVQATNKTITQIFDLLAFVSADFVISSSIFSNSLTSCSMESADEKVKSFSRLKLL